MENSTNTKTMPTRFQMKFKSKCNYSAIGGSSDPIEYLPASSFHFSDPPVQCTIRMQNWMRHWRRRNHRDKDPLVGKHDADYNTSISTPSSSKFQGCNKSPPFLVLSCTGVCATTNHIPLMKDPSTTHLPYEIQPPALR